MSKHPNPKKLRRPLGLATAAAILLSITVFLGAALGVMTQSQFSEVERSWAAYVGGPERKGALISELRGFLGYGGIIHNFKNYVLRQDDVYLRETQEQLVRFAAVTKAFTSLPLNDTERGALSTITNTVGTYERNLLLAERAALEGWSPARTDAAVRIDDTPALDALRALEGAWRAQQQDYTARMLDAVQEGRTLIWIGYWSIGALVLAALAIGALVYFLVRDLRRAVEDLRHELHERQRLQRSQERPGDHRRPKPRDHRDDRHERAHPICEPKVRSPQRMERRRSDRADACLSAIGGNLVRYLQHHSRGSGQWQAVARRLSQCAQGRNTLLGRNHAVASDGRRRAGAELCRDRRRRHRSPARARSGRARPKA